MKLTETRADVLRLIADGRHLGDYVPRYRPGARRGRQAFPVTIAIRAADWLAKHGLVRVTDASVLRGSNLEPTEAGIAELRAIDEREATKNRVEGERYGVLRLEPETVLQQAHVERGIVGFRSPRSVTYAVIDFDGNVVKTKNVLTGLDQYEIWPNRRTAQKQTDWFNGKSENRAGFRFVAAKNVAGDRHPRNLTRYKSLDRLAADPRVLEVWDEGPDGLWVTLAPGWNWDGTASLHEYRVSELIDKLRYVTRGDPY